MSSHLRRTAFARWTSDRLRSPRPEIHVTEIRRKIRNKNGKLGRKWSTERIFFDESTATNGRWKLDGIKTNMAKGRGGNRGKVQRRWNRKPKRCRRKNYEDGEQK